MAAGRPSSMPPGSKRRMSGAPSSRPGERLPLIGAGRAASTPRAAEVHAVRTAPGAADDGGKPSAAKERGAEAGPTFEEALAKAKPVHKEPEADGSLGVQAATHGPAETEAAERTAAPHSR